mmetsp:Transcript_2349/g.6206  ORF Transcript_2349/g.6206 Transcript_2349/m.6206 type:complete len:145 (-) Transcript_2349:95-529(-)
MTPQTQIKIADSPSQVRQTDFSAGRGNALQACVASLFGLPLDDVPNFIEIECGYERGIRDFVSSPSERPMEMRKIIINGTNEPRKEDRGKLCILRGKSPRGNFGHVVVARVKAAGAGFEMVHDPHPDDTFLDIAEPYGWYMIFD